MDMKEYLKQRGFDDETIKAWKLKISTDEVLIHYLDPNGNLLYTRRNRPGKQPKYMSPPSDKMPGGHSCLYGLHMLKNMTDTLLIIEGEYNAISAWAMGYHALGVAGQSMSLQDYHLKDILNTVKKIIILYDKPELATERAKDVLKYYRNIDYEMKVSIAKYKDDKDANDYLKEDRRIDFKAIINTADPYIEDRLMSPEIKVRIPENDFVAAYKEYAIQMTDAPAKYQELMALSIIATVLSRKVYLKNGVYNLYPNLFIVLLGKSTVMRKTACLNIAKHILRKYKPELILPNDFTPEGLFNLLSDKPSGIISWSEFGAFLINANTKSYQAGIKEFITEAYDCPDVLSKRLAGKEYEIKDICLNITTASTIHWFADRINEADTMGGFLGRFVYMPCSDKDKTTWYYMQQQEPVELGNKLVSDIRKISELKGEVEISDQARVLLIKWLRRHEDELEKLDDSKGLIGFYARLSDYLLKFAILYEISSYRSRVISEDSMLRAIRLVNQLKGHISELLGDHIAFTKEGKEMQKVLNLIKTEGTVKRDKLLQYSHMTAKQLDEVLTTLVQSNRISVFNIEEGQRRARAYKVI